MFGSLSNAASPIAHWNLAATRSLPDTAGSAFGSSGPRQAQSHKHRVSSYRDITVLYSTPAARSFADCPRPIPTHPDVLLDQPGRGFWSAGAPRAARFERRSWISVSQTGDMQAGCENRPGRPQRSRNPSRLLVDELPGEYPRTRRAVSGSASPEKPASRHSPPRFAPAPAFGFPSARGHRRQPNFEVILRAWSARRTNPPAKKRESRAV